ncbi:MAG TPA: hypothetical protein VHC45_00575 [Gaiellaceae bacterium]|jgi:hypothetical protein|nr:hypothetical protein [Gaiellaceae bacterium]
MKRLLAVIAGGLGVRALWRRRGRSTPSPSAADLRAKLDEHRALEADRLADEAGQTPVDKAQDVDAQSVEGRRAEVHERARRALDELS